MAQTHRNDVMSAFSKMWDMIYDVTFDPSRMEGRVIVNVSYVDRDDLDRVIEIYREVDRSGISLSPYIKILEREGYRTLEIMTICSMTIDGLLLKHGIPINPIGGGVLCVRDGMGVRFTHFLKYESTTMDPLEVLAGMGLTSILKVVRTGSGRILGNMREVPMVAREDTEAILGEVIDSGFRGIIEVGEPNAELFDIPTERDHFGVVIVGGMNPVIAAEEEGVRVETHAMKGVVEISTMEKISDV